MLVLVGLGFASRAEAAPPAPREGVYESCAPYGDLERCVERLRHIRSGGFTAVLNYAQFYATEEELRAYADAAHDLGIKLIWSLKDRPWWGRGSLHREYPMLASSCGCETDRSFVRHVLRMLRGHPATWGYYVADEPARREARPITRFSKRVRRLDPKHPRLYVEIGDMRRLRPQLARFRRAADVVSADIYPVGTSQPLSTVADVSRVVRSTARRRSRESALVLQAFSWAQYPDAASAIRLSDPPWPTAGQMRRMRGMARGHSLVLWYSYFDIMRSPDPDRHWADLVEAAGLARG